MSYIPIDPQSALALYQHGQAPGLGAYAKVGDYSWEFFGPEAFAWERPADSTPQPAPMLSGLGGCGCGGKCGGCGDGHSHGVGQATGAGVLGTGCFASMDFTTWSWCEWGSIALGLYLVGSLVGDIRAGASRGKKTFRAFTR